MIKRDRYIAKLIDSKNNGFPKVITGVRRCGKSYLLTDMFYNHLQECGVSEECILIIDLDSDKNANLRTPIELGNYVRHYCKGKKSCYVILDEIQRVDTIINPAYTGGEVVLAKPNDKNTISFVDVILGLSKEKNIDLYVTGSNSKMLSSDIVTEFRDKATNIHLRPLSFEEFYEYVGGSKTEAIYEYMQYGGMPLSVLKKSNEKRAYLKGLFNTTYFKDIIEHNHLKKSEALDELCNILSTCVGQPINSKKIADTYKSVTKKNIDDETVTRYINFFEDAFLLNEVKRYDVKGRKEIGAQRKYYFVDTGLRNARLDFVFPDERQLIENTIYNELIYNGYSVNVGAYEAVEKDENGKSIRTRYEIDFYAKRDNRIYYIQACDDISDARTKKREVKAFNLLSDPIEKILVVNKPIPVTRDENGYTIISLTDFLLEYIKWQEDILGQWSYVETVVQLSKGNISSQNVRVEFSLEDMDMSRFQQGATYEQIKEWVKEKYGFHVSHLNIAKTKRKCGIIERQNYNLPKSEDSRSPETPKEKEEAIMEAFKHFQMI